MGANRRAVTVKHSFQMWLHRGSSGLGARISPPFFAANGIDKDDIFVFSKSGCGSGLLGQL